MGTLECICIGWVYGAGNFLKDVELMTKSNNRILRYYWSSCWMVISPLLLLALVIVSYIQYKPLQIDDYVFPAWVIFIENNNCQN